MTDVIEGMARAMCAADNNGRDHYDNTALKSCYLAHAQAALDYLKQPAPASKPLPSGQGPEMSQEQVEAMDDVYGCRCPYRNPDCPTCYPEKLEARKEAMKPVWQPIIDCLRGDAP